MFLNLVMLAGIGGAVLPLVLHLLARSRYETLEWGAMMFLEGYDPREARDAKLRQWTLLGVRMAMVGLLAVALARPVVGGRVAEPLGVAVRVTAVIVLDRTYSMAHDEGGRSRLDRAREAALQVLSSLQKGDEVSLVLLGEQVEVVYPEPTTNLQAAARAVADVQVSTGAAELAGGLARARAILNEPGLGKRELYVVTDRQSLNWSALEGEAGRELRSWTADAQTPTQVYVVPVGGESAENVVVESVALAESPAVRGQTCEVEVRVRNFGASPQAGLDLALFVTTPDDPARRPGESGKPAGRVPVTVAAKSSATVRMPVSFDRSGSHVVTAEVESPGLRDDNRFDLAIDVADPAEVLVLGGDERRPEAMRESFYLKHAMMPHASAGKAEGDPAVVTVRPVEELDRADLSRYRVVVLANVPQLTPEQVRLLEQRVYDGAGLVVAPGNLTRVESYNADLYRDGQGLLPARLSAPTAADGSEVTTVGEIDGTHAIFRFPGGTLAPRSTVTRYFPATVRAWDAATAAKFASGDPFVVEGPRGRGRVVLVTTPLDADWGTLPLSPFYLPFVQSTVRFAGSQATPSRNLAPGEPLVASFDEPLDEQGISLSRNEEAVKDVAYLPVRNQVRCAETYRPGIYGLRVRPQGGREERTVHFVVQLPRRESDLTVIDAVRWAKLRDSLGLVELDPAAERVGTALSTRRSGRELWLPLLVAVMALGVVDVWLAKRWSREAHA